MTRAVALVLCLLLAACGGTPADEEDVVYLDVAWSFGKDQEELDSPSPADAPLPADAAPGADAVPGVDTVPGEDAVAPEDTVVPADTPVPLDTHFDTGPCGGCPADLPNCVAGVCKCTPFSCTDGTYCKGGVCVPCTVDAHCGPGCLSCPSMGQFCVAEGTHCVDCDAGHPCPASQSCIDSVCTPCEDLGFCGPDCLTCPPETPDCAGGACVCNGGSCPQGSACEAGTCVGCTAADPAHCGPDCLVCAGGTPHCLAGACALCDTAAACGPSCQPCAGPAGVCAPGGAGCVECLVDGDCPPGAHCGDAQACVPNCAAQGCATDGAPDADKCSQARIAGRLDAANGGATFTGDTEGESNDDDLAQGWFPPSKCNDDGEDHFYRIWLRPGEILAVQLDVQDNDFDAMLKLYEGTECDENDAGIFDDNDAYLVDCWNGDGEGDDESFVWTADAEGWYTVVVDGRVEYNDDDWPPDGDYGPYAITLILTCTDANCCCD
jgi:hypothetical protein